MNENEKKWNNEGVGLSNLGRDEEAIEAYEKAIMINPEYSEAWYDKGVGLGNLKRYEEAIEAFKKGN